MNHLEPHDLVRISRVDDLEALICRVHMSTTDCVVASELSDSLDLDGLCIVPTRSIRCFDRVFERAEYYRAALGAWPDVKPYEALLGELSCNMVHDLRVLAYKSETVAIYMELDDPDICYVGTVHELTETALRLDRISSRGKRISESLRIELKSITKIELATRYLIAVGYAARTLAAKK